MTVIDTRQESLPLAVVRMSETDVSDAVISRLPSMKAAIKLCAEMAPVDDKVICIELGIDPGQWSRIKSGLAHFPEERFNLFQDICGNEVPARYAALSRGYGLVRLKSAVEAELAAEKMENAELRLKLRHFEEFQKLGK